MGLFNKSACLLLLVSLCVSSDAFPCAAFSFKDGDALIFGRNVDSPDAPPGVVVVNKRGVYREGVTFAWLYGGKKDKSPKITWVSKYGSITFNYSGIEFPDGGMNEAGLFFEEMTLLETKYPADQSKPTLFMSQWIQYILDTCASTAQVVENAKQINLDGWNWHFYAADKNGERAVIEFLDGTAVIHRDKILPYSILTNSIYTEELAKIKQYQGFGGDKVLDVKDYDGPSRFVRGAGMIARFNPRIDACPVDYGFRLLDTISPDHMRFPSITSLAKVYDVKNRRIFFRTSIAKKIRYVNMDAFDYSCQTPIKILDMHIDRAGDVTSNFTDYSAEADHEILVKHFEHFTKIPEFRQYMKDNNVSLESIVKRHADYKKTVSCQEK